MAVFRAFGYTHRQTEQKIFVNIDESGKLSARRGLSGGAVVHIPQGAGCPVGCRGARGGFLWAGWLYPLRGGCGASCRGFCGFCGASCGCGWAVGWFWASVRCGAFSREFCALSFRGCLSGAVFGVSGLWVYPLFRARNGEDAFLFSGYPNTP